MLKTRRAMGRNVLGEWGERRARYVDERGKVARAAGINGLGRISQPA